MSEALWNIVTIITILALGGVIFTAVGMWLVGMLGFVDD